MNEFRAVRRGAEVGFGTAMEATLGFSRALRVGDLIFVSGMTATDLSGKVVAEGMYDQMKMIYQKIDLVLKAHDSGIKDVVKVVWYMADIAGDFGPVTRAHNEAFGDVRPVLTGVGVKLVDPAMLVEMDAIAVIRSEGADDNLKRVVGA